MKRVLLSICLMAVFSAISSAQSFTYYYPHIANGISEAATWRTTIFITNSSSNEGAASGVITFTQSNGSPYNVQFIDEANMPVGSGNAIPFQLASGESRKYISVAAGPLTTGFATVTANAPVMGAAMFTQFDGGGRMLGEAGVPAAIPLGRQAIFVDTTNGFKTGVAIANPNTGALQVHFELVTTTGQKIMTTTRDLPPNQHISFFVDTLFPGMPAMVGRLQFYCHNPMVSVGLRFEPSFVLFTTLPPIAIQ